SEWRGGRGRKLGRDGQHRSRARNAKKIDERISTMLSRRNFLAGSAVALVGATAISGRAAVAAIPEAPTYASPAMKPPLPPQNGQAYQPVVTLNGWTLPFRMNGEWKEVHLVAAEVEHEVAPVMTVKGWACSGQT